MEFSSSLFRSIVSVPKIAKYLWEGDLCESDGSMRTSYWFLFSCAMQELVRSVLDQLDQLESKFDFDQMLKLYWKQNIKSVVILTLLTSPTNNPSSLNKQRIIWKRSSKFIPFTVWKFDFFTPETRDWNFSANQ